MSSVSYLKKLLLQLPVEDFVYSSVFGGKYSKLVAMPV